jgi:hypothetical protein
VEKEADRRLMARAAVLESTQRLAVLLGVSSDLVTRWIEGLEPIPLDKLLHCVDLVLEHIDLLLEHKHNQRPNEPISGGSG